MPLSIFHAFNWKFHKISSHLESIANLGFRAVQISPAQKSFPVHQPADKPDEAWFMRYQPYDYSRIEGLGDANDLAQLCEQAQKFEVFIIADVVFNHVGASFDQNQAKILSDDLRAGGERRAAAETYLRQFLSSFPQFSPLDFHSFKPIDGQDYDQKEHRYDGWGGAGTWPDLKPTAQVLEVQREHLALLHSCGVRGFRFDAVKQLYPDTQYLPLCSYCRSLPDVALVYGEVLSTDVQMHQEYETGGLTTNFELVQMLVDAFEEQKVFDWESLLQYPQSSQYVVFSRNHDTVMQYLPSLSFRDDRKAALAGAFVLCTRSEPVLVLDSDIFEPGFSRVTLEALKFRRLWSAREQLSGIPLVPTAHTIAESPKVLLIEIENEAMVILNASDKSFCTAVDALNSGSDFLRGHNQQRLEVEPWGLVCLQKGP